MKYTVTTTENGCVVEFEFEGKIYRMKWVETDFGMCSTDIELSEQLSADGVEDEMLLDAIGDFIDGCNIGLDMYKIERELV